MRNKIQWDEEDKIMEYATVIRYITTIMAVVFVLVTLTNIISQVIKKMVNRESCPAQVVVFIIAEILSVMAMMITCSIMKWQTFWYYWPLSIIVGVMVCYGAMFGYDNLYKQISTAIKALIEALFQKEG